MKKAATFAFAAVAALTLSACGSSDKASEAPEAENVEMPAEEAMGGVDANATPVADSAATASDAAAANTGAPGETSPAPAAAAATPTASASAAPAPAAKP